ncbi:MAG: putative minor capsid protein 10B [Prokaryotic dsDNA virus sp.]|nr:MAG: putative minor capsid protein 10B [Prokaryotic dsDNA virus sp.]|tara:strand:+ start:32737 stop:33684 length:948 start_codon:yes stop_codon:yes gene_type:complete
MSGFQTGTQNVDHLTRSLVWSNQLKEVLKDELMGAQYVNWLNEFPDGDTFVIPSIGEAVVRDYTENEPVVYDAMDTGEFQFSITDYISSATYITNKAKQDMFYMNQLVSSFVPEQSRAIGRRVETDIFALQSQQTASDLNVINGANHRFIGSGSNETLDVSDFARALYALKKANVPQRNLIAIVDPSVEFAINAITNISNVSNNPRWEGIIESGIGQDMSFIKNIYGFDVYTTNYLSDMNETIDGKTTTAGKANMFFSADAGVLPFVGAWRQMPTVESEYNKDRQREEYLTVARYGLKLFRPENLVVIGTDTDQV